ncbi:MAG TPA: alpha/beta hydrolase [Caulobacteraceae bacterium]|nr:alpha/beta hydrolase [Caulobacteraceae bacterium]
MIPLHRLRSPTIERRVRDRVNLALLGLIFCLTLAAAPPPGLHVDCRGQRTAAPTVILESGAFGTSADWDLVLDDLAVSGRVCAYDRAGVGASPPRSGEEDVVSIARELAGLLDTQGETQPVILVGHSNGALYAEAFAALMPQRLAGLVYVNGVTSNDIAEPALVADLTRERRASNLAVTAARLGLAPILADAMAGSEALPGPASERKRRALSRLRRLKVARDEDRAIVPGLSAVAALGGSPAGIPTVAIISMPRRPSTLDETWARAEAVPARRADVGWVLTLPGGTHTSPLARDRAYVEAAVAWLRDLATTPRR